MVESTEKQQQQNEKVSQQPFASPPPRRKPKVKKPPPKSNATWANVFLPEIGEKGAGSKPHWDMRPKSFREVSFFALILLNKVNCISRDQEQKTFSDCVVCREFCVCRRRQVYAIIAMGQGIKNAQCALVLIFIPQMVN